MKMETQTKKVKRSEEFLETEFGINNDDSAHILSILRDKLYSNKVLAVIREYATNARDAHVEAGIQDRPIEIQLPTPLNLHFTVRDYGPSLTPEDIREVYVLYGRSTKRQTNSAVGQLGLGCKSGFAYGDNFIIITYLDGIATIYNAYLEETGKGKIAQMSRLPTEEKDGVLIDIPVRRENVIEFCDTAKETLKWFDVPPIMTCGDETVSLNCPWHDKDVMLSGQGWTVKGSGSSYAIMGGIAYPISQEALGHSLREFEKALLKTGIWIKCAIGDLSIAANREALEYKQATISAIRKVLNQANQNVIIKLNDEFKTCTSLLEAKRKFSMIFHSNNNHFAQYLKFAGGHVKTIWTAPNGKTFQLDHCILDVSRALQYTPSPSIKNKFASKSVEFKTKIKVITYDSNYRASKATYKQKQIWKINIRNASDHYTGYPTSNVFTQGRFRHNKHTHLQDNKPIVLVEDNGVDKRWFARSITIYQELTKKYPDGFTLYIVQFANPIERKQLFDIFGLECMDWLQISDYEPTIFRGVHIASGEVDKKKHRTKTFIYESLQQRSNVKSDYFKPCEVVDDNITNEFLYVGTDHMYIYMIQNSNIQNFIDGKMRDDWNFQQYPYVLTDAIEILKSLGLKDPKIYAIRGKSIRSLPKNWKPLTEKIMELLKVNADKPLQRHIDWNVARLYINDNIKHLAEHFTTEASEVRQSIVCKYVEACIVMEQAVKGTIKFEGKLVIWDTKHPLMRFLDRHAKQMLEAIKPTHDLEAMQKEIMTHYPLLGMMGIFPLDKNRSYYHSNPLDIGRPDYLKAITIYIKLVYLETKT